MPRKAKLFSKTPSTPISTNVDLSVKQQATISSDKIAVVKKPTVASEETFELQNTEIKKLEHLTKHRPKRDRNKKPTNGTVSSQKIETVELNEDLVVIEKTEEPPITLPTAPATTTKPTTPSEPQSTPKTPIIPKTNAEQPIVSIDALERIKLRATVKKANESKDAESTPTTTATQGSDNSMGVPGMIKQNKLRYSCYVGSSTGKSPLSATSSHQVNTIVEDDSIPNEIKPIKIPPVKPPKPQAPPKPSLTSSSQQQDSSQTEQTPTPFVRLRPVSKPVALATSAAVVSQVDSPSTATSNNESNNKTDQDKRQSVSVKERIQFLSEESKVSRQKKETFLFLFDFILF